MGTSKESRMSIKPAKSPKVHDLTKGPIARTLLAFALPTLGANVLQSLNGSINTIWIGRFLGESALAATSNANIVMFLLFSLGFGFGMAASILVAQSVGAGQIEQARRVMGTTFGLFAVFSALIALMGWFIAPAMLHLMATPPAAQMLALAYLRVIFLGLPPMFLGVLLSMGLRGTGDSITPLLFMVMGAILDAGLNPVFILGLGPAPRMGIAGSATATLISNYAVLFATLIYIYGRDLPLRLRGAELRFLLPDRAVLRTIFVKGLPMGLQMIVMTVSGFVMIGLVNRRGVEVAAAYSVAQQLWTYIQMPAMAIGSAVSAMAAQNIGAGAWDRVGRITQAGVIAILLVTGATAAAMVGFDRPVLALFLGGASPALPIARHIQLIVTWSFTMFGVMMVLFATVRANGSVIPPLAIMTVGLLGVRIGMAWTTISYGEDWLWWSFVVGSAVTMTMAAIYYRYGNWRRSRMAIEPADAKSQTEAVQEPGGRLNPSGEGTPEWVAGA
jgi:putative MATE family efflux protein